MKISVYDSSPGKSKTGQGGKNFMTTLAAKNDIYVKQHQVLHAHIKYLINAVGRLDLQSFPQHIADAKSIKNRITLYRWSITDFKEAIKRDIELHKAVFHNSPSLTSILNKNQDALEQIDKAAQLIEKSPVKGILREELNVLLVKTNLAVNTICEALTLNMNAEDELAKSLKMASGS
jgi:hypothetical protein